MDSKYEWLKSIGRKVMKFKLLMSLMTLGTAAAISIPLLGRKNSHDKRHI
jgi:hypothetical protein